METKCKLLQFRLRWFSKRKKFSYLIAVIRNKRFPGMNMYRYKIFHLVIM